MIEKEKIIKKKEITLEDKINFLYARAKREDKIKTIKLSIYWGIRALVVSIIFYGWLWINRKIDETQRYISNLANPTIIKEQMIEVIKNSKNSIIHKGGEIWNSGKEKIEGLFGN